MNSKNKCLTQEDMVLEHLNTYGSISTWESYDKYGITRLSAKIYDLKKQGHDIISKTKVDKNRFGVPTHYSVYFFRKDRCLNCEHLDDSDLPNFFCNISCEMLNAEPDQNIVCPLDKNA